MGCEQRAEHLDIRCCFVLDKYKKQLLDLLLEGFKGHLKGNRHKRTSHKILFNYIEPAVD